MTTRRRFLSIVAASLVAGGVAGQPQPKVWRLGYLVVTPITDPPSPERAAFLAALRDRGYGVGTNLAIEYRSAQSDREQLPFLADELVGMKVDAIVVGSSDAARAVMNATKSIPIVMLGIGDPIAFGLVTNLARPGSNITGVSWQSFDLIDKRLELIKQVLPRAGRLAYLWNPETVESSAGYAATKEAARKAGLVLDELRVSDSEELQRAIGVLERTRSDVLYVNIDPRISTFRQIIADAAIRLRIPSISGYRGFVDAGGLMSYGASLPQLYRRGAVYVDRVFRGANPADLAIEQPRTFEVAINLKTAKAIGITIPKSVLLRADEIIR